MAEAESTGRKVLVPAISAIVLLVVFSTLFLFRDKVFESLGKSGSHGFKSLFSWIPDHKGQTTVILVTLAICIAVDWVAHIVGRLRPWIFVVVFQIGVWILFWNTFIGQSGKDSLGLSKVGDLSVKEQAISILIILVISGVVFWLLEAKENWRKYRHQQSTED